jgi:hypothetical protein
MNYENECIIKRVLSQYILVLYSLFRHQTDKFHLKQTLNEKNNH